MSLETKGRHANAGPSLFALVLPGLAEVLGCAHSQSVRPIATLRPDYDSTQCAAVQVALDSILIDVRPRRSQQIVLLTPTEAHSPTKYLPEYMARLKATKGLEADTWTDFLAQNSSEHSVGCPAIEGRLVMDDRPTNRKDSDSFWSRFRKRHPTAGAVAILSGIGANPARTQMFMVITFNLSEISGSEFRVLLSRSDASARWSVTSFSKQYMGN